MKKGAFFMCHTLHCLLSVGPAHCPLPSLTRFARAHGWAGHTVGSPTELVARLEAEVVVGLGLEVAHAEELVVNVLRHLGPVVLNWRSK